MFVLFHFVLSQGGKGNGQGIGTLKRRSVWVCWVVITKYHRAGNFRNRNGFSRSSGGLRYKVSVLAGFPEASRLALLMAAFSLWPHMAFSVFLGLPVVSVSPSPLRVQTQVRLGPPSWPHFILITLL